MNQVLPKGPRGPEKFRIVKYSRPSAAPKNREKRNEWYSRLTNRQKRVAIAEDAEAQVLAGKFIPEQMIMMSISSTPAVELPDAQQLIDHKEFVCSVCERGALLASCIRLGDGEKSFGWGPITEKRRLRPVFGLNTLRRLETLFEGWPIRMSWNSVDGEPYSMPSIDQREAMERWLVSRRNWKPRARMLELMRNIARNSGDVVLYGVKINENPEEFVD